MSFILDALKKSETERQGQRGLGVADVPVARDAPKAPPWIWWLLGLLGVNLLVLAAVLLRPRAETESARVPQAATEERVSSGAAASVRRTVPDVVAPELAAVVDRARAERDRTADAGEPPAAARPAVERTTAAPQTTQPDARPVSPARTPAQTRTETPPPRPVATEPPPARSPQTAGTALALPTLDELRVRGDTELPDLHLDIHVWSEQPRGRFVYVNTVKYREGESLGEGPRVAAIVREGVVLEYRGERFLLPRE